MFMLTYVYDYKCKICAKLLFFLTLMCKIIEMYMLMREKMWGNSVGNSWEIFKFVVIKFGMLTAVTWKIYGRCS